jgi:hypothetical protein
MSIFHVIYPEKPPQKALILLNDNVEYNAYNRAFLRGNDDVSGRETGEPEKAANKAGD